MDGRRLSRNSSSSSLQLEEQASEDLDSVGFCPSSFGAISMSWCGDWLESIREKLVLTTGTELCCSSLCKSLPASSLLPIVCVTFKKKSIFSNTYREQKCFKSLITTRSWTTAHSHTWGRIVGACQNDKWVSVKHRRNASHAQTTDLSELTLVFRLHLDLIQTLMWPFVCILPQWHVTLGHLDWKKGDNMSQDPVSAGSSW